MSAAASTNLPLKPSRAVRLRPYQEAAHQQLRSAWRAGRRWQLVVLPTGCGKTLTALSVVATALERGKRVLWLAHREELIAQPTRALSALWPALGDRVGIVKARRDEHRRQVVFASVDTLARSQRMERVLGSGPLDLVVVDEAHHSASTSWTRVLKSVEAHADESSRPCFFLGLTATPERADGRPLGKLWEVAYAYPITRAIESGFLVPPRIVVEQLDLDLEGLDCSGGDYDTRQLGGLVMEADVVHHTVQEMERHARGRKAVVFTVTVAQAEETARALEAAGWRAGAVFGEMPTKARAELLRDLTDGRLDVVCNAAVLTEGWDDPSVDCVVLARPTRSGALFRQMVGRGLRLYPDKKDCLVLDLAGASKEFSLLQAGALLKDGSLEGKPKSKQRRFVCPEHPGIFRLGAGVCILRGDGQLCGRKLVPNRGEEHTLYNGMARERVRAEFSWVKVQGLDRQAWALSAGQEGMVVMVEGELGWRALLIRKYDRLEALASGEVDEELATGLCEDFARQTNAVKLARRRAHWRQQPTSRGQSDLACKLGLEVSFANAGEAERAITEALALKKLIRTGLAWPAGASGLSLSRGVMR